MTLYAIYTDEEGCFTEWFEGETLKSQRQVLDRLSKIELYGHFGHVKNLDSEGDGLHELKFNDGRRIYYVIVPINNVVLLIGGNKNGQDKDIKKARSILFKAIKRFKAR